MLYIIGLGLNADGISKFGLDMIEKCKKVYIESYTVDFPYSEQELKDVIKKKAISANREFIESLKIVDEAKKMNVALLVYGSPLTATTHITLIHEAKLSGVKYKVIYNSSILDAVAETGLQIYKFGKIVSIPAWKKNYEPDSFMEVIKQNQTIGAHTLILCDIGLEFHQAMKQLDSSAKKHKILLKKIIVCQRLGTKYSKIFYRTFEEFLEFTSVKKPYCIIIPSKLHFLEKEILENV